MRSYTLAVTLFLLTTLITKGQACDKAEANNFVDSLLKNGQYLSYDSTRFVGYSKKLTLLKTPLLSKLLPDYCFYSTTFFSSFYEYPNVETGIAFSKSSSEKTLFIHSPVFTNESTDFMNLFYGLEISDTAERVNLAREITGIFSEITYAGHVNRLINVRDNKTISFELWHNDLSWRIYEFYFDNTNKLTQIKIKKGAGRGTMTAEYVRQ